MFESLKAHTCEVCHKISGRPDLNGLRLPLRAKALKINGAYLTALKVACKRCRKRLTRSMIAGETEIKINDGLSVTIIKE
jgi:hypothetical protein